MHLGWSSRTYPLDAADLARAPDGGRGIDPADLPDDEVVLYIRKDAPDVLLRGRDAVRRAGAGTVDVRIVFKPEIAKWNLPFTLLRTLRNKRRFLSSGTYHIATAAIRQMGVERAVRTLGNPQRRENADRGSVMSQLAKSLRENGYDDTKPINVMLCRSSGCEDSLRQGHHRISACVECGVEKMAVRFSAAGALPRGLVRFVRKPRLRVDVLKSALESKCGTAIDRLVPLVEGGGEDGFIVVPENGGRFIVKLYRDRPRAEPEGGSRGDGIIGGRYTRIFGYGKGEGLRGGLVFAAGIAPFVIVPLLVAGAIVLDVAVMKSAGGERSPLAWFQTGCAAVAALLVLAVAAGDRRGRPAIACLGSLFLSMSIYELLEDVFDVKPHWAALAAAAVPFAAGVWNAVASRRLFGEGVRRIVASRCFHALPAGLASILVVSKIVSSRAIWGALSLSPEELRNVKRIVEEGVELFGYALILCGSVSFAAERLVAWKGKAGTK